MNSSKIIKNTRQPGLHEIFLYSMLKEALRERKTEVLLNMGFFIKDLHRQL